MTEAWKSNPMHWCDVCRCWMNDSKAARLNHERGTKHQENLARKLRDMAKKADEEKRQEKQLAATMSSLEAEAAKRFKADQHAAQAAAGSWAWDAPSGYYYNEKHGWYYDAKTQWYHGGSPPEWTQQPLGLPSAARFGAAPVEGGPAAGGVAAAAAGGAGSGAAASISGGGGSSRSIAGAAGAASSVPGHVPGVSKIVRTVVAVPQHPQALIGGHQMPMEGRIGGAKGVGSAAGGTAAGSKGKGGAAGAAPAAGAGSKRKSIDPEEAAALARREAARQRVQARTMTTFGLT